ncbi:MAG: hypothetical protein LBB39_02115 [Mycoplasmataceae bacterium]|nr:hypothetical protein [Mycoplasmataceae bacterium]
MKEEKYRVNIVKILSYALIFVFSISVFLQLLGPLIYNNTAEYKNVWKFFIFFTHQTGIISMIYAILLLINKSKKLNSYLGIINTGNFLIVNIVAWVVLKSYTGWDVNFNLNVLTDILDHFVLFILSTTLWLTTLTNKYFYRYNATVRVKPTLLFSSLFPTTFLIFAIVFNFVKIDGAYFSVYGILTNFNPLNDGSYWTFVVVPFIYLIFLSTTYLYFYLFNHHYYEYNFNRDLSVKEYGRLNFLIYFYSIFLFIDFLVFIGTIYNSESILFKVLMVISLIICVAAIIYCIIIFVRFLKLGIYSFLNILFTLIIICSFLEIIGKITAVLYLLNIFDKFFNTLSVGNIAIVCSSYCGLNIVLAIWSFCYLNTRRVSKEV